jgi:MFS family permease
MLVAGGLTDRFRVRHIGLGVILILAVACLAMSRVGSVPELIAIIFLLRLMGQGMMSQAAMVAMARWFVASRGRAVSIASLGTALGEAVLPITFVLLMTVVDWRTLWVVAGVLLLAFLPILWRLLRRERTPRSFATEGHAGGLGGRNWSRGEVIRHGLFWLLVPTVLGPSACNTAFFFNQAHIAAVKGWTHLEFVQLFPLFTLTSVGFMVASGWVVDRFGAGRLMALFLLPGAAGYLVVALAQTIPMAAVALMLLGMTSGMNATVASTFWAEFFGTRHLGKIRATTTAVMVVGTAIGPLLSGVLIDHGIDFPHQCYGITVYFVLASLLSGIGVVRAGKPGLRLAV